MIFKDILECVFEDYDVMDIISPWTNLVHGKILKVADTTFLFRDSQTHSFNVADYCSTEDMHLKKISLSGSPTSSYFTASHLDFSSNKSRTNFVLVRAKKAYDIVDVNGDRVKVNSELLDVSAITPLSAETRSTYQKIEAVGFFPRLLLY